MTYDEGRDAILAVFKSAWGNRTARYADVPGEPPTTDVLWARATVKHVDGGIGALTSGTGTRMHDRIGYVWIEVYAKQGDGHTAGYAAAQEIVDASEDYNGPVWFKNIRLTEGESDGVYSRFDVKADFEYSRVR
jgi:hypothetical protein